MASEHPHILLCPDRDDAHIADWLAERLRTALEERAGEVAICLPGGETPFPILKILAAQPLDWPRVVIWPGDERLVGEGDPHSNVGRLRASFAATPARVVALAEGMLKNGTVPPRFALAWLGMGGDGHVASLFPNTDPRTDDPRPLRRITPDPLPPEAPYPRLTLTLPVFLAADRLVFVIRGAAKRALFEAAMAGEIDLPVARLLRAAKGPVTCFC